MKKFLWGAGYVIYTTTFIVYIMVMDRLPDWLAWTLLPVLMAPLFGLMILALVTTNRMVKASRRHIPVVICNHDGSMIWLVGLTGAQAAQAMIDHGPHQDWRLGEYDAVVGEVVTP